MDKIDNMDEKKYMELILKLHYQQNLYLLY